MGSLVDTSREAYVVCENCSDRSNLPVSFFCNNCGRLLFEFGWLHYILLLGSIFGIGFLIGYFHHNWLGSAYVSLMIAVYSLVTLRAESNAIPLSLFIMILTLPVVFVALQGNLGIPRMAEILFLIHLAVVVSIVAAFVFAWVKSCGAHQVPLWKGSTVVSITLFLATVLAVTVISFIGLEDSGKIIRILNYPPIALGRVSTFLIKTIDVRLITASIVGVWIFVVAAVEVFKKPFPRGSSWLESKISIDPLPTDGLGGFGAALLSPVYFAANVGIAIVNVVIEIVRFLANVLKIMIEIVVKWLINYAVEIVILIGESLSVFLRTYYYFLKGFPLQLALYLLIAVHSNVLIIDIAEYIHSSTPINLLSFGFNVVMIGCESILLFWSLTGRRLIPTSNSIGRNYLASVLVIWISAFFASLLLWILPLWIERLTFRPVEYTGRWPLFISIGPFQAISLFVIIGFVIFVMIRQYLISKRRRSLAA